MEDILLDTDIGDDIDDAFALALIMSSPELRLLGVTTVYRNAAERRDIVKSILAGYGRPDIPVYAGEDVPPDDEMRFFNYDTVECGKPVIRHFVPGMTRYDPDATDAAEYIAGQLNARPGEITILAIGPLTNLARVHRLYPDALAKAKRIVFMGGQLKDDYREWNVKCDVASAEAVFSSGADIVMVTRDVTVRCIMGAGDVERVRKNCSCHPFLYRMLKVWFADKDYRLALTMHDALAVGILLRDFCGMEKTHVKILTDDKTRGITRVGTGVPVTATVWVDAAAFIAWMLDRLEAYAHP